MESGGYSPKDLHFQDEARSKLINGITKMAKAVKSTLGPMGNTVLIESPQHTHGPRSTGSSLPAGSVSDHATGVAGTALPVRHQARRADDTRLESPA